MIIHCVTTGGVDDNHCLNFLLISGGSLATIWKISGQYMNNV